MRRHAPGALALAALCAFGALGPARVDAQQSQTLRRAVAAYSDLSYGTAVTLARSALRERLSGPDQERAWEILGFAYAALDSARPATDAFRQLLLLNPDRSLDPGRISPKITSLFALAMGQVLVVRQLGVEGGPFVAGTNDALTVRFTVTRTARLRARLVGEGRSVTLDSLLGDGTLRLRWNGLMSDGRAAGTGSYRLIVEASAGREEYAASLPLRIVAGAVDTVAHLASLPGYDLLPETIVPPRSWRPFALASIASLGVAGASVSLDNAALRGSRRELLAVASATTVVGLLATLRRPAAVPAEANVRYNRLVMEQLARRNSEIAEENASRRTRVRLTVESERRPAAAGGGAP